MRVVRRFAKLTCSLPCHPLSPSLWLDRLEPDRQVPSRSCCGIAVYIFITGLVYFLILRYTWNPKGLPLVADVLLHYGMPLLYGIEWMLFTPKGFLHWQDALRWLVFPLGFVLWALFWGAIFGFYPYPFIVSVFSFSPSTRASSDDF